MNHLSIDIETYSSVDIQKCGLYRYAQSPDFQIMLLAFAWDNQPVYLIDMMNRSNPFQLQIIQQALQDPNVIKHAYNAPFEWYCFNRAGFQTPIEQWRCTMAHGLYCGYTAGLGATGEAIGIPQDKRKLGTGKALINYFCKPCEPTAKNGNRTRNLSHHEPEKWELFKTYCCQDVEAEREIERRLSIWPMPEKEQKLWELDAKINAYGVAADREMIEGALYCGNTAYAELLKEATAVSGLQNPNSVKQLTEWLNEELEDDLEEDLATINADAVAELLAKGVSSERATRMLELRQQLGKTSTKKYDAMAAAICDDGRIRGLLQYYGANRTGRWAGRLVQIQNLPRNHMPLGELDFARQLVKEKRLDDLRMCFNDLPDTLSQLIRTAFIPSPGNSLIGADFSAIEARVIAWLAGERWVMDVFASHGKIYEATAAQMFGVPIEKIKKGNPEYELRQRGKVATLALGYGGGTNALIHMGALEKGLTEEELPDIVRRWRLANPNIVRLWYELEGAAMDCVQTGRQTSCHGIVFTMEGDPTTKQEFMTVLLPAGRKLFYVRPTIQIGNFDKPALFYWGISQDSKSKSKKWRQISTWGGKIAENLTQAIARDCLAEILLMIDAAGLPSVFHVHDEDGIDSPFNCLEQVLAMMAQPIPWAPGLILKGDGSAMNYYRKE